MASNIFTPKYDGGRTLMVILFVLWGLGGFLLAIIAVAGASALAGAVMATAGGILWIGGMVFFGMGALMSAPTYEMTNVRRRGSYKGCAYREMVDGSIEARLDSEWLSFEDWTAFKATIKARN